MAYVNFSSCVYMTLVFFIFSDFKHKIITADKEDCVTLDDFTLVIGAGCLAEDTEIKLINDHQNNDFTSLISAVKPRVVRFFPTGLQFLKPANLIISLPSKRFHHPRFEFFILHGTYHSEYQETTWELVTNGIEESDDKRTVVVKVNSFSFYSYISTTRSKLAQILSHLNHSFTCRAYAFYRRVSSLNTIDVSVVLVSEFVDEKAGEDVKQLTDHLALGYVLGEKGFLKPVRTNCFINMTLDFSGIDNIPVKFKVGESELDSIGFVADHFKRVEINHPASGEVKISEIQRNPDNETLWRLNVIENVEPDIKVESLQGNLNKHVLH